MLADLSITFPIFAVIAIGYAAVRARIFGTDDSGSLGGFVLTIALPATSCSFVTLSVLLALLG